jgi:hypothetical protein
MNAAETKSFQFMERALEIVSRFSDNRSFSESEKRKHKRSSGTGEE